MPTLTGAISKPLPARVRRGVKASMLAGLDLLGQALPAPGVPILCYHSIDDTGSPLSVTPALFEQHMVFLKRHGYRAIAAGDFCRRLIERRPLSRRIVVLTFDDGYRNNHRAAMPVLLRFGFTATVFVVTGYVGRRMTWAKTLDVPDLEMASWDEIEEMAEAGLDIQAHTVSHPDLRELDASAAREEIETSKAEIESRLGRPVTVFAYPYGTYKTETARIVEGLGFEGAVTARPGRARRDDGLFTLKRVNVTDVSRVSNATQMHHFGCCVRGTAGWYTGLKQCLPMLVTGPGSNGARHTDEQS